MTNKMTMSLRDAAITNSVRKYAKTRSLSDMGWRSVANEWSDEDIIELTSTSSNLAEAVEIIEDAMMDSKDV